MDKDEIKSVDNEDAELSGNETNEALENEEAELITDEESLPIEDEEIINEKKIKIKKVRKPINKRKTIITTAIIVVVLILIGSVGAIWYVADSNSYVAKVGNTRISKTEFEYYLKQNKLSAENQAIQQSQLEDTEAAKKTFWETKDTQSGTTQAAALKTSTLDLLYQIQIEVDEALKKDPNALKTQEPISKKTIVDGYTQSKQSESDFIKSIKDQFGISYDTFIKFTTRYDVALAHYTQAQKDITKTDEEVLNYYNTNKASIDLVTIKYSMYLTIDTTTSQPLSAEKIAVAKTKAEAALAKLKNGADFDQLITDESEDPNKATGKGETQFSTDPTSQKYLKDISDPLKTMVVNEYKLIEIPNQGYIVIKYIKLSTFDDVKDSVKTSMQSEDYQKIVQTLRDAKPLVENQKGKVIDNIDILAL